MGMIMGRSLYCAISLWGRGTPAKLADKACLHNLDAGAKTSEASWRRLHGWQSR